jgi:hypothetical protein
MVGSSELGGDGATAFYGIEADRTAAGLAALSGQEAGRRPQRIQRDMGGYENGHSQSDGQQQQSLQQQLDTVREENSRWQRVNNQLYQMVVNNALAPKTADAVATPEQGRRKKPRNRT